MQVVPRETDPRFTSILRENGIRPTDEQLRMLSMYEDLLVGWNKQINLVSRSTEASDIRFTHFIHSLAPLFFCSITRPVRILDIGSGGGLPGIPIAILKPEFHIVLVDSIAKKAKAMEAMTHELGLSNVQVLRARAEEIVKQNLVDTLFDLVVARAVAPLSDLAGWARTVVRAGGPPLTWNARGRNAAFRLPALMAWKGGDIAAELDAMKRKTGLGASEFPLVFPGSEQIGLEEKKIVIVELLAERGTR